MRDIASGPLGVPGRPVTGTCTVGWVDCIVGTQVLVRVGVRDLNVRTAAGACLTAAAFCAADNARALRASQLQHAAASSKKPAGQQPRKVSGSLVG
jgi:hypothetical protein